MHIIIFTTHTYKIPVTDSFYVVITVADMAVGWSLGRCVCMWGDNSGGCGVLLASTGPAFQMLQASCLIWF